jgi:hypothetical protein
MTSQINYNAINASYPIAGQDNDSQGFRDNFSAIQIALTTASNEITNLQLYGAQTNKTNDFNGNKITGAVLAGNSPLADGYSGVYNWGTNGNLVSSPTTSTITITYGNADYIISQANTSTQYNFTNWPGPGKLGKVTLEIQPSVTNTNITFVSGVSTTVRPDNATVYSSNGFTVTTTSTQIWDIWTTDSGANLYVQLKGLWSNAV